MVRFFFTFLLFLELQVALYFLACWLFGPIDKKVEAAIIRRGERRLQARLAELTEDYR